jgi:RNA polymerase sigma-70 factor, ECF subfamily
VSLNNAAALFWFKNRLFLKFKVLGERPGITKCGAEEIQMNDHGAAHLGKKLSEIFEEMAPAPLPRRLVELLEALAAKDKPPASEKMKNALIALIPNLRAFAYSLCGQHERADDMVQETLLKAWSHLDSFQAGTNLRAWLFTILRNTFFSEMRKRRREVEDADGKRAESLSVGPAQQGHVDMQDLHKVLDLLPPHQREALMLVGAAGMSYEEAAEIAKCAVGTVKSRVNRARSRLAELLGVDGAEAFGPDFATGAITGRIVSAQ